MQRSDFIKTLGLGASGLLLPKNLLTRSDVKIYDNYVRKGKRHSKRGFSFEFGKRIRQYSRCLCRTSLF